MFHGNRLKYTHTSNTYVYRYIHIIITSRDNAHITHLKTLITTRIQRIKLVHMSETFDICTNILLYIFTYFSDTIICIDNICRR